MSFIKCLITEKSSFHFGTTALLSVLCVAAVSLSSGCGSGKQNRQYSPQELGIGQPVLPAGKGVDKSFNNTAPRPIPTNK